MQCLIEKTLPDGCAPLHFKSEEACANWKEEPLDLKQRFEKLEQVARELYAALHINEHCSMEFIRDKGDCDYFMEKLEDLGVSVDG